MSNLSEPEIQTIIKIAKSLPDHGIYELKGSIIAIDKKIYSDIKHSSILHMDKVFDHCITVCSAMTATAKEVEQIIKDNK